MLGTLIKIRLQGIFARSFKNNKKKNVGIGTKILMGLLFLYLGVVFLGMFGVFFNSMLKPFIAIGYEWLYFAMMAITVVMIGFIASLFMTQQELYGAKDNDLLLSMSIEPRDILLSRICVLLIWNYLYEVLIGLPCIFVYFKDVGFDIVKLLFFIVVMITLPFIALALSCIFGWFMALVMKKMKSKTAITLVLSLVFLGLYFYFVMKLQQYFNLLIANGASIAEAIKKTLFPIYHLSIALSEKNIVSLLLYLVFVIVLFAVVIFVLSKNFIAITTSKQATKKVKVKASDLKAHTMRVTLLQREWTHFSSNPSVILNTAMGIIFTIVMAVAFVIKGQDIIAMLETIPKEMQGMIEEVKMPLLCFAVIMVNSLDTISGSSISLEGNRLWILKSFPIQTKDILRTKLIFHLLLCFPMAVVCSIIGSVVLSLSVLESLVVIIAPALFLLCQGITGLLLNLWKPKFDWVNETVVVKQSMPIMILMFGDMALVAVIAILYLAVCSKFMSVTVYTYIWCGLFLIADIILARLLNTWGVKRFEEL